MSNKTELDIATECCRKALKGVSNQEHKGWVKLAELSTQKKKLLQLQNKARFQNGLSF